MRVHNYSNTTLMTKVNNEFIRASKIFEIAIWVVVSRPASVEKVQEVIRNKLDIPEDRWRNRTEDEKAVEIFNVLKAKRFVMLLDDVWERLDLQKVGVPSPNSQNKSKVILTTALWMFVGIWKLEKALMWSV